MAIPEGIRQWRKEQRATLLWRRATVSGDLHGKWNDAITTFLVEGFPILRSEVVGGYWPYRREFDPRFALRYSRKHGVRVALPVVVQKNAPLQFREWWPGARVRMSGGAINLPVPDGTDVLRPKVLLVPPVGFDLRGYRLGYGGGYFDRTLAAMVPHPLKIGVGFELSRIQTIQPQAHDVPMDFIVTEAGIHYASETGLQLITDRSKVLALVQSITAGRGGTAGQNVQPRQDPPQSPASTDPPGCRSSPGYTREIGVAHRNG